MLIRDDLKFQTVCNRTNFENLHCKRKLNQYLITCIKICEILVDSKKFCIPNHFKMDYYNFLISSECDKNVSFFFITDTLTH